MEQMVIVQKMPGCQDIPLPVYASKWASGVDLHAAIEDQFVVIHPGDIKLVSSGIMVQLPYGHEAQIRPRSGLALEKGLSIVNSPGTIDSDYRGPVGIILINHGKDKIYIEKGERIAQMVIAPVTQSVFREGIVNETERGTGGFGSTDKK